MRAFCPRSCPSLWQSFNRTNFQIPVFRLKRLSIRLFAIASLLTACSDPPRALELSLAAEGEWIVRGIGENGVVVIHMPGDAARRGRQLPSPRVGLMRETIESIDAQTIQLKLDTASLDVVRADGLYFSLPGPQLVRSPAAANRYVIEYADAIWLFAAPDTVIKLTSDDDVAELRSRQREGEVILYWSVDPVWSADGRYVAFITNRESVRGGTETQSIWVIDIEKRQHSPLVVLPSAAAHTEGVFGEEFLYTSSSSTGVLAVHPQTANSRRLSEGLLLASHPRGEAVAITAGNPEARDIWIFGWRFDALRLATPGERLTWSTQSHFSPSGNRFAVVATDNAGFYRLHVFMEETRTSLSVDIPGGPTTQPFWISESALIFSSGKPGEALRTWVVRLK